MTRSGDRWEPPLKTPGVPHAFIFSKIKRRTKGRQKKCHAIFLAMMNSEAGEVTK
jgi:hypothetical protein